MYFVQHGLAVAEQIDPSRPLSSDGRRDVERVAAHLKDVGVAVEKVCHSGKTRAKETAQILSSQIGDGDVYEVSGMSPNDNVVAFAVGLNEDNAMYVGHLPHLGKVVSYLVAGEEDAGVVRFVNGGIVCVEKDTTGYQVKWYLIPSLCKG
jgi:phosphohistidine phosphatase